MDSGCASDVIAKLSIAPPLALHYSNFAGFVHGKIYGMSGQKLIVFVKAPRPGAVKTRLAQSIGAEAACAAYCRLAEKLFAQLAKLSDVELRFSPDDAAAEIKPWLRNSWEMRP